MADLRAQAMDLLAKIPEENMPQVLSQIATMYEKYRPLTAEEQAEDNRRRKEAWERLQKYIGRLPADFDYKKELEEAREERFKKYANLG